MKLFKHARRSKRGAALVEYGLIVAGVALVAAAAVSIFGTKVAGMIGTSAAAMPGAQAQDNGPIGVGKAIATTRDANNNLVLDGQHSLDHTLGDNLGIDTDELINDPATSQ